MDLQADTMPLERCDVCTGVAEMWTEIIMTLLKTNSKAAMQVSRVC